MRKRISSAAAAVPLGLVALAAALPSSAAADAQCTTLASQDHASVITVLPANNGTTTAASNSGGQIDCTT